MWGCAGGCGRKVGCVVCVWNVDGDWLVGGRVVGGWCVVGAWRVRGWCVDGAWMVCGRCSDGVVMDIVKL